MSRSGADNINDDNKHHTPTMWVKVSSGQSFCGPYLKYTRIGKRHLIQEWDPASRESGVHWKPPQALFWGNLTGVAGWLRSRTMGFSKFFLISWALAFLNGGVTWKESPNGLRTCTAPAEAACSRAGQ